MAFLCEEKMFVLISLILQKEDFNFTDDLVQAFSGAHSTQSFDLKRLILVHFIIIFPTSEKV